MLQSIVNLLDLQKAWLFFMSNVEHEIHETCSDVLGTVLVVKSADVSQT